METNKMIKKLIKHIPKDKAKTRKNLRKKLDQIGYMLISEEIYDDYESKAFSAVIDLIDEFDDKIQINANLNSGEVQLEIEVDKEISKTEEIFLKDLLNQYLDSRIHHDSQEKNITYDVKKNGKVTITLTVTNLDFNSVEGVPNPKYHNGTRKEYENFHGETDWSEVDNA